MKQLIAALSMGVLLVTGCSTQTAAPSDNSTSRTSNTLSTNNSIANDNGTSQSSWSAGVVLYPQEVDNDSFYIQEMATLPIAHRIRISGKMRTFEAVGATRLLVDEKPVLQSSGTNGGVIIIHGSAGAPAWGDFKAQYSYPARLSGHKAIIEFYFNSPKDGSKQDLLQLHVVLP